jgi:hypothetical protein
MVRGNSLPAYLILLNYLQLLQMTAGSKKQLLLSIVTLICMLKKWESGRLTITD